MIKVNGIQLEINFSLWVDAGDTFCNFPHFSDLLVSYQFKFQISSHRIIQRPSFLIVHEFVGFLKKLFFPINDDSIIIFSFDSSTKY